LPKGYYERYRAIVWGKPEPKPKKKRFIGKKRSFRPNIENMEKMFPGGQKHLAESLGISTRTLRYWKSGERNPTKTHVWKVIHTEKTTEQYIKLVQSNYGLSRNQAIKKVRDVYKQRDKEEPDSPESDKYIEVISP